MSPDDSAPPGSISKNARKKELKSIQREEERRRKVEEKANQAAAKTISRGQKFAVDEDEELDPTRYFENRIRYLSDVKAEAKNPYPHKFSVSMSIAEYVEKFGNLSDGQHLQDTTVSLAGRIMCKRSSSSKLFFYDVFDNGSKVQVMADASKSDMNEIEFPKFHSYVKRGDIVGLTGFPGKTKRGELSIFPASFIVLSHDLHMMPNAAAKKPEVLTNGSARNLDMHILKDKETRYRQRYLDLILNSGPSDIFKTRSVIMEYIQNFLNELGFLEVETTMLNMIPGGAAARPFVTHHRELNKKLYMRIAPELDLKKLIVGGLDRVFEMGKQFRNEGIDLTHNPEFTTCEFYMAYADYNDLMQITETLLSGLVQKLTGGYVIKYHANEFDNNPIEIDFTPPFKRMDMIKELEKMANLDIPKDLSSDDANKYLKSACQRFELICHPPQTTARLLDKLVGHFLEECCVNPTFIINHPEIMSPLAKWHRSEPGLTERFELFINKHELCNAYTELNDPVVQRQRFADQLKDRQLGDDEAMALDEDFCTALEYGLPPTAGWGLGVDRLTMLLTDSQNIKEVILFPAMKPNEEPLEKSNVEASIADYKKFKIKDPLESVCIETTRAISELDVGSDHSAPINAFCNCVQVKERVMLQRVEDGDYKDEKIEINYRESRLKYLAGHKAEGKNPYPHKFCVTMPIVTFIEKYRCLHPSQLLKDVTISLAGRIMGSSSSSSSRLFLCDLHDSHANVSVLVDGSNSNVGISEFTSSCLGLKRGDIVGFTGYPGKTETGVLTMFSSSFVVLSHCLHMMPTQELTSISYNPSAKKKAVWMPGFCRNPEEYLLNDKAKRYGQRYLDIMLNSDVRELFRIRSSIIHYLRNFLNKLDFLQVETSMLQVIHGGAFAHPFVTYHNELNMQLYLRISPEHELKKLIIGGLGRVYELGKQFRNEGLDPIHNPEFTTCEFYMAYADCHDMMELTERLLSGLIRELTGGYKISYRANGDDNDPVVIDFTPPFRRMDLVKELEKQTKLNVPRDLSTDAANMYLMDACRNFGISCPLPQTTPRLLDQLVGHFLRQNCLDPTFIVNHPEIMTPLAKSHRLEPGLNESSELIVCKMKICKVCTELNDPMIMRQRFDHQLRMLKNGDETAMPCNEEFCKALEYGMPPTGGCKFGVDRLTMLLTDSQDIKEVILFPMLPPAI